MCPYLCTSEVPAELPAIHHGVRLHLRGGGRPALLHLVAQVDPAPRQVSGPGFDREADSDGARPHDMMLYVLCYTILTFCHTYTYIHTHTLYIYIYIYIYIVARLDSLRDGATGAGRLPVLPGRRRRGQVPRLHDRDTYIYIYICVYIYIYMYQPIHICSILYSE